MTALYITIGAVILIALFGWLYGRSKKQEGISEADAAIAKNAAKLREKQIEIANQPNRSRDAILDGLSGKEHVFTVPAISVDER